MLIPVQAAAEPSKRTFLCLRGPRSQDLLQLREESECGQAGRGRIPEERERERGGEGRYSESESERERELA